MKHGHSLLLSGIVLFLNTFSLFSIGDRKSPLENQAVLITIEKELDLFFATNVKINNIPIKGRFLIDTGAATIITKKVANDVALKESSKKSIITDDYESHTVYGTPCRFSIDGFEFKSIRTNVTDEIDLGIGVFCDVVGIIGSNLMKQCIWRFTSETVEIYPNKLTPDILSQYNKEKLILQGNNKSMPYIVTELVRPRATALFDTGDNGLIQINKISLPYIPIQEKISGYGKHTKRLLSHQDSPDTLKYEAIKVEKLTFAGLNISYPIAYIEEDNESWAIGSEFFYYFDTILDFPAKSIYVKQIKNEYSNNAWNSFGLSLCFEQGNIIVAFVWDNSPASLAHIKPGDMVISINQLQSSNLKSLSSCEVYKKIQNELAKDKITITLQKRNDIIYTCNLVKKSLFEKD